jgi:hypothetical protein
MDTPKRTGALAIYLSGWLGDRAIKFGLLVTPTVGHPVTGNMQMLAGIVFYYVQGASSNLPHHLLLVAPVWRCPEKEDAGSPVFSGAY